MSQTKIFITRKLEKAINEFIFENDSIENEYLGDWNCTLFHVSHKKCWILINNKTKYLIILPNVKKADSINLSSIFKDNFYAQLVYEGIKIEYELIDKIVGEIKLCETNINKSAIGSLNNSLVRIENWKLKFGNFENINFRDLNSRLNRLPNKMLNWKNPKEEMSEMIKSFSR